MKGLINNEAEYMSVLSADNFADFMVIAKNYPSATAEVNRELFKKYKEGDIEAYHELIMRNLGLIVSTVKKYRNITASFNMLDLIQEGIIGFIKSLETYDMEKGELSTYAKIWIYRYVGNSIMEKDKMISRPKILNTRLFRYRKLLKEASLNGREPKDEEIASALEINAQALNDLKSDPLFDPRSLNASSSSTDRLKEELETTIPSSENLMEELNSKIFENELLAYLKDTLSPFKYYILYYRVFSEEKISFKDMAKKFGTSVQAPSFNFRNILKDLKKIIQPNRPIVIPNIAFLREKYDIDTFEQLPLDPDSFIRYMYLGDQFDEKTRILYKLWITRTNKYGPEYYANLLGVSLKEILSMASTIRTAILKINCEDYKVFEDYIIQKYKTGLFNVDLDSEIFKDSKNYHI